MKKLLIVCLLLFTACTQTNEPAIEPPSIFSDPLCGKSCWNEIVVGQTSEQELLAIVRELSSVNLDSITVLDGPFGLFDERVFFSLSKDSTGEQALVKVSAYTINEEISTLIFLGDLGITFQDVIDAFGEPELVSSWISHSGDVDMTFLSPSQGIAFGYQARSEKINVSPDTEIIMLEIFDPDLYPKLLAANWLVPDTKLTLYPWNGYGKIEEHYWPPIKP